MLGPGLVSQQRGPGPGEASSTQRWTPCCNPQGRLSSSPSASASAGKDSDDDSQTTGPGAGTRAGPAPGRCFPSPGPPGAKAPQPSALTVGQARLGLQCPHIHIPGAETRTPRDTWRQGDPGLRSIWAPSVRSLQAGMSLILLGPKPALGGARPSCWELSPFTWASRSPGPACCGGRGDEGQSCGCSRDRDQGRGVSGL